MDHMMMQFSFKGQRLFADANNNNGKRGSGGDKYQLRPRGGGGRAPREPRAPRNKESPRSATGGNNGRPRSAPLSKYRRKTANARERSRMREINRAFEALRRCVPHWAAAASSTSTVTPQGEKLTKITTLRLAMRYIGSLAAALQDQEGPSSVEGCSDESSRLLCSDSSSSLPPDSPFLSSPDCSSSHSPVLDLGDSACGLSSLDFDGPVLLHDAFAEDPAALSVDGFSDYFLT